MYDTKLKTKNLWKRSALGYFIGHTALGYTMSYLLQVGIKKMLPKPMEQSHTKC